MTRRRLSRFGRACGRRSAWLGLTHVPRPSGRAVRPRWHGKREGWPAPVAVSVRCPAAFWHDGLARTERWVFPFDRAMKPGLRQKGADRTRWGQPFVTSYLTKTARLAPLARFFCPDPPSPPLGMIWDTHKVPLTVPPERPSLRDGCLHGLAWHVAGMYAIAWKNCSHALSL